MTLFQNRQVFGEQNKYIVECENCLQVFLHLKRACKRRALTSVRQNKTTEQKKKRTPVEIVYVVYCYTTRIGNFISEGNGFVQSMYKIYSAYQKCYILLGFTFHMHSYLFHFSVRSRCCCWCSCCCCWCWCCCYSWLYIRWVSKRPDNALHLTRQ